MGTDVRLLVNMEKKHLLTLSI